MPFDIVQYIVDHGAREWAVVRDAPGAALILCGIAFVLAWFLLDFKYSASNKLLREQVDDFRERLGLVPADSTSHSKLTHQELRKEVERFIPDLHALAERDKQGNPSNRIWVDMTREMRQASTDEAVRLVSERYADRIREESLNWSMQISSEYESGLRSKAIILRDEMLKRLPPEAKGLIVYESLPGARPLYRIAGDLQRLSLLLPTRKTRL